MYLETYISQNIHYVIFSAYEELRPEFIFTCTILATYSDDVREKVRTSCSMNVNFEL
jgi:hypothetical protein